MNPVDELPAELADRLQRLVDLETSGSSPWPGVDRAMQRAHRRRMAGVSTLVAASVLAGGFAFNGLAAPNALPDPVAPAITSSPAPAADLLVAPITKNLTLAEAGYTGAVGGSLGDNPAWLGALRSQVVELHQYLNFKVESPDDVHVLWAGDLNGSRYAVVLVQQTVIDEQRKTWVSLLLEGEAGADTKRMSNFHAARDLGRSLSTETAVDFAMTATGNRGPVAMFVRAPRAKSVEVATGRRFFADGRVVTTWQPLVKQGGSVWTGTLTGDKFYLGEYRVDGKYRGAPDNPDDGRDNRDNGHERPDDGSAALAPAGTDLEALRTADNQALLQGASIAERAVIATSLPLGGRNTLAASVLRAPDGGYLIGLAEHQALAMTDRDRMFRNRNPPSRSQVVSMRTRQPFRVPDDVMAAVLVPGTARTTPEHPRPHYLVLAPAGTVEIRIGGVTAPVHNRLAVLDLLETPSPAVKVEALALNGKAITTVTAVDGRSGDQSDQAQVSVVTQEGNSGH
jgi:hypothetical protein